MIRKNYSRTTIIQLVACVVVLWRLAGISELIAQPSEWTYGGQSSREFALGGCATTMCGASGQVVVGRTIPPDPLSGTRTDAYVVRTTGSGTPIWEGVYDITATGANDVAYGVMETPALGGLPSGYVVVGTTDVTGSGTQTDVFAMRLDCNGNVLWTYFYGSWQTNDVARSVALLSDGNYIIAGWTFGGQSGTRDGYLIKIAPNGVPIWGRTYDAGLADYFYSVTEARFMGAGGSPGDIVAVGGTTSYGNAAQGWALRVDALGFVTAFPQGGAAYGGSGNEDFNSVRELTWGNLVYAGHTTSTANGVNDCYLLETTPDPCKQTAGRIIGDLGGSDEDMTLSVCEVTVPQGSAGAPLAPVGQLIVTGLSNNGRVGTDVILLPVNVFTLAPLGRGFAYGDHGNLNEVGFYVHDDPAGQGYYAAGYTQSNLDVAVHPGDPEDFYVVAADPQGLTGCEEPWNPSDAISPWESDCHDPTIGQMGHYDLISSHTMRPNWGVLVCPSLPKSRSDEPRTPGGIAEEPGMLSFPNPVARGSVVNLGFTPVGSEAISVSVTDVLGRTVSTFTVLPDLAPSIPVSTEEWPAGSYLITATQGTVTRTMHVVVE